MIIFYPATPFFLVNSWYGEEMIVFSVYENSFTLIDIKVAHKSVNENVLKDFPTCSIELFVALSEN